MVPRASDCLSDVVSVSTAGGRFTSCWRERWVQVFRVVHLGMSVAGDRRMFAFISRREHVSDNRFLVPLQEKAGFTECVTYRGPSSCFGVIYEIKWDTGTSLTPV